MASKASKPSPYGRSVLPGTQAQDPFIQAHIKELNGVIGNNDNNNNYYYYTNNKQLLDEVFWISGIIKVEVSVISRA